MGTLFGVLGAARGRCKGVTTGPADIETEHCLALTHGKPHGRVSAASIFAKEYDASRYIIRDTLRKTVVTTFSILFDYISGPETCLLA